MIRSTLCILAVAVCAATSAAAQGTEQAPRPGELATVTVTARRADNLFTRAWHVQEGRQYVLGLAEGNRKLMAELRRSDAKVAKLEGRLAVAKVEHERREAAVAAIDSTTAETRRARLDLEEKLRVLESARGIAQSSGSQR